VEPRGGKSKHFEEDLEGIKHPDCLKNTILVRSWHA
jgi:hypothetical protein